MTTISSDEERTAPSQLGVNLARLVACGFGSGLSPVAPGTAGSAAAIILAFAAREVGIPTTPLITALIIVPLFFLGWRCSDVVLQHQRRENSTLQSHKANDPGYIVIDEWVGQFITLCGAPLSPFSGLVAFVTFRILDVVKPGPIKHAERLPGGLGIMADDCIAGIFGMVVMFILHQLGLV